LARNRETSREPQIRAITGRIQRFYPYSERFGAFAALGWSRIVEPLHEKDPSSNAGRIFVVDDEEPTRRLLRRILEASGYAIEEFEAAEPALDRIGQDPPDLVLLDLNLPDRNGHEVLEEIRSDPVTRLLPVVMLTGHATPDQRIRAAREGVSDFVVKPFSPDELLPRVRSLVSLKRFADEHEHASHVILTLAKTIDARDPHTAGHSGRVAASADRLGELMGMEDGPRDDMRRGALFHDLGKIVIPDAILHKPGALTPDERRVVEEHPAVGHELLTPMRTMRRSLAVVRHHHEKLDGSGYPDGLTASQIPLAVRVVTVADIFDALISDRPHRSALRLETAFEILEEGVEKGWWDGEVVRILRAAVGERGLTGWTAA
jgi:putative two-component system response regulator